MTTILITGGIVAAVVILGAYIRWGLQPMLVGYRAGVTVGRQAIREMERRETLLIRTLGDAAADATEPLERERPSRSEWYDRPLPLAALAAVLRPARAVRKLRSADDVAVYVLDAMLAQKRKHDENAGASA
jgi:hypothetical protein